MKGHAVEHTQLERNVVDRGKRHKITHDIESDIGELMRKERQSVQDGQSFPCFYLPPKNNKPNTSQLAAGRDGRQLAFAYRCDEEPSNRIIAGRGGLLISAGCKNDIFPTRDPLEECPFQSPEESWLGPAIQLSRHERLPKSKTED